MTRPWHAARRILVVAPHPDDEAIAAYGLMRHAGRIGARLDVLVASDGAASHPGSRSWPRTRLVAERRRETLRAMRSLGLTPDRLRFLGLPDGALPARSADLRRLLARSVLGRAAPDLIVGPQPDDAHADHRAVAEALARVRRRGERRLGYRVWPTPTRSPRGPSVPLDGLARQIKRRVIRGYRTQMGLIADAETGFAMSRRQLHGFVQPCERFAWCR